MNDYVAEFIRILRKVEGLDLFPETAKLSKTEFRILREIIEESEKGGEIISSELARRIGITRSAISQIVNKMEQRGIVKRVPAPNDKKIAYVRLSESTLGIYEEQCRQAGDFLKKIVAVYGKENMEKFISSCNDLIDAFKTVKTESGNAERAERE